MRLAAAIPGEESATQTEVGWTLRRSRLLLVSGQSRVDDSLSI